MGQQAAAPLHSRGQHTVPSADRTPASFGAQSARPVCRGGIISARAQRTEGGHGHALPRPRHELSKQTADHGPAFTPPADKAPRAEAEAVHQSESVIESVVAALALALAITLAIAASRQRSRTAVTSQHRLPESFAGSKPDSRTALTALRTALSRRPRSLAIAAAALRNTANPLSGDTAPLGVASTSSSRSHMLAATARQRRSRPREREFVFNRQQLGSGECTDVDDAEGRDDGQREEGQRARCRLIRDARNVQGQRRKIGAIYANSAS